jgi:ABC-type branched-subunit amino acid transport system substrate-binding protein
VPCTRMDQAYVAASLGAEQAAALGYAVESSTACAESASDTIERYGDDIGTEVAYENTSLAFGLPNGLGPEVTAMKDAGVDVIFACFDQNGAKALGEELRRQGLDIPFVQNESYDTEFIGANAEAYEGAIMTSTIRPAEAIQDGTDRELFEEWMGEIGAETRPGISAHGWVLARLAYEGIEAAGPGFDRASVIEATNAIEDYTAGGLLAVPWDIGRQHEIATDDDPDSTGWVPYCFVLLRIEDGAGTFLEPSSEEEPSLCWESRGGPYAEPEPTDVE